MKQDCFNKKNYVKYIQSKAVSIFSRIFPERTYLFFLLSSIFAIVSLGIFSIERFREFSYNPLVSSYRFLIYIFDPLFFHLLSLCFFSVIIYYLFEPVIKTKWKRLNISLVIPVIFLVFGFAFTTYVLKPAFGFNEGTKLDPAAFQPFFTSMVKQFFNQDYYLMESNHPSGFLFRQVHILFFGFLLIFYQPKYQQPFMGKKRVFLNCSLLGILLSTIAIILVQLYFGLQSIFTVVLSISAAISIFWIVFYLLGLIFGGRTSELTTSIVALTAITFPLFFYFSNDAYYWFYISIGFIFVMGIAHFFWGHYNHIPTSISRVDKVDVMID